MRRNTNNRSLYDLAPDLIKEWHPSANAGLTPRKVTFGYPEKVWWICRESHEWRATIEDRVKGNGCPVCAKEQSKIIPRDDKNTSAMGNNLNHIETASITAAAIFEPDNFGDSLGRDFRNSRRYKIKATAVIESPNTGHWFYADVKILVPAVCALK